MSEYVSTLRADTSQHDKAMADSAKKVNEYKKQTDQASASVDKMQQSTSRSTQALMRELSSMESAGRSTTNYKRQLSELQKQITDLTINYRNMSDAEKQSALGNEVAQKIDELKQKAAEYKDAMLDVNAEIKNMASDTANWDGMKQGIDIVSSSMQTFISLTGLNEKESERLLQVMNKVKLAEAGFNTAIKVGNALQRQSALMQSIRTLQTKAATTATNMQTAATGKATVAQAAFNAVANANPYVLLATAVITVVSALAVFCKKSKEATQAQDEQLDSAKDLEKEYKNNLNNTLSGTITQFRLLQGQYKQLTSDTDKTNWIKNNKTAFDDLGISVKNLTDAEDAFAGNTNKVVESLKKRAEITAKQTRLNELVKQQLEEQDKIEQWKSTHTPVKAGEKSKSSSHTTEGGYEYINNAGQWVYTQKGADKYNAGPTGAYDRLGKQIEDLANEIASGMDINVTTGGTDKGNGKKDIIAEKGSLADLEEQLSEKTLTLKNVNLSAEGQKQLMDEIDALSKQIEAKKISLGLAEDKTQKEFENNLKKAVEGGMNALESTTSNTETVIKPVEMFSSAVQTVEDTFKENNDILAGYNSNLQTLASSIDKVKESIDDLNEAGGTDQSKWTEEAKQVYDELVQKLQVLQAEYTNVQSKALVLTATQNQLNKRIAEQNKLAAHNDMYNGVKQVDNVARGLVRTIKSASESWSEMSEYDKFNTIIDGVYSTIDAFTSLMEAIKAIENTYKSLAAVEQATSAVEAITTQQHISNEAQKQAADTTTIGIKTVEAGVTATANGTQAGWPAMLVAIPIALAAVAAAIASAKSFSTGGIIDAAASLGDYNIARVNSGEMILNTSQQARLFRLANEGQLNPNNGTQAGKVEFKIRGQELVGVLKNYNSKISRV